MESVKTYIDIVSSFEQDLTEGLALNGTAGLILLGVIAVGGAVLSPPVEIAGGTYNMAMPGSAPKDAKLIKLPDGRKVKCWTHTGKAGQQTLMYEVVK